MQQSNKERSWIIKNYIVLDQGSVLFKIRTANLECEAI
jgi:hypothetical protein